MTGSIQPKDNKLYAVLHFRDSPTTYKNKWVFTGLMVRGNKRKAEAMLPELIQQYQHLEYQEKSNERYFVDEIMLWLERKKGLVDISTWEGYQLYATKHIIPYFEPMELKLDEVKPKHIQDYYHAKLTGGRCDRKPGGLSVDSVRKHSIVLNQVFAEAVIAERILRNPAISVPIPKKEQEKKEEVFLNLEQANRLIEGFRGHHLHDLVYVTLLYGLRRSEVLGLKWNAVDLEKNTIEIKHVVVKHTSTVAKDKTKSAASHRIYPLLPEVRELLLEIKKKNAIERNEFGEGYHRSDYIFVSPDGHLIKPDHVTRTFRNMVAKIGLPPMRFHDLRHSTASILYDRGWALKDIQEWLGHSDIEVTANIYTHISQQRRAEKSRDLEGAFKR